MHNHRRLNSVSALHRIVLCSHEGLVSNISSCCKIRREQTESLCFRICSFSCTYGGGISGYSACATWRLLPPMLYDNKLEVLFMLLAPATATDSHIYLSFLLSSVLPLGKRVLHQVLPLDREKTSPACLQSVVFPPTTKIKPGLAPSDVLL